MQKITRGKLDQFIKKHATNVQVLDIGSSFSPYQEYFPNRVTMDINPKFGTDFVGDIHQMPFKDETFEMIICTEVLEHCYNPQLAVNELRRVLKTGGKLILTTRFVFPLHDSPNDYFRYTRYGIKQLFKEWGNIEPQAETEAFSAIGALMQRVCFQTKLKWNKPVKGILSVLSWIFSKLDFLIVQEYGNIEKSKEEKSIMTTGWYVVAIK